MGTLLGFACRFVALALAVVGVACSGSTPAAPTATSTSNASAPAPAPAPAPTPTPAPPAIPQLGGVWSGTHEYQFDGMRGLIPITLTLTQSNRSLSGTWRSATALSEENGDFTGTIVGEGSTASVTGTVNIVADTARGVGRCRARATVSSENQVSATSLRLRGPNIEILDCAGNIGGLIWILRR